MTTKKKGTTIAPQNFIGAIFDKHPTVEVISWHQYYDLNGFFYVEPWSVHVNENYTSAGASGSNPTQEEVDAGFDLTGLMLLALGEDEHSGVLDYTTPIAVNTGNLLRALFGTDVIVTLHRDGSIEREASDQPENLKIMAEIHDEEDANVKALQVHVAGCPPCKCAVDHNQKVVNPKQMCEVGRKLALPFELGEFTGKELWEQLHEDLEKKDTAEEAIMFDRAHREVGRQLVALARGTRNPLPGPR